MTTDIATLDEIAAELYAAERGQAPVAPPSERWPGLTVADAYRIQTVNVQRRLAEGRRVRGHKVGLTSRAMQEMLGVSEPDYGHLLDDMFVPSGGDVEVSRFCAPRVEPEIAFVLGRALHGPDCQPDDVLTATEMLRPALEIIDSRVADWRITLADTIADNASSAAVVLGDEVKPSEQLHLADVDVVLSKNGDTVAEGSTGAVLGNPTTAVAWLVNKLHEFGASLEPGHVVLPGSCTRAVDVGFRDTVRAEFNAVGSVCVSFVGGAS